MQKQTPTPDANSMSVTVARFGHRTEAIRVPAGSTVQSVLNQSSLELEGNEELFVEGTKAEANDILEDGDILSIVTPKQAG